MLEPCGSDGCGISPRLLVSRSVSSGAVVMVFSLRCGGGWSAVELLEGAGKDQLAKLAVAHRGTQPGQFAGVVAPRLVAGEQPPVVPDAATLDLGGQPARGEADRPGQVGVDALA